jgi:hypothetical protein
MRFFAVGFIVCCLLLSSCSRPPYATRVLSERTEQPKGQLVNIRIERWGTILFSGLLAVKENQSGLQYAMLDSSGIKLLEAEVETTGENRVVHAKKGMKESRLPEFLSNSLRRVYLLKPAVLPCTTTLLLTFCMEQSTDLLHQPSKSVYAGPITLWEVQTGLAGERGTITLYSQPWAGVRIYLEDFHSN